MKIRKYITAATMAVLALSANAQSFIVFGIDGSKTEFKTEDVEKIEFLEKADPYNGHEYVDLGLPSGIKWATMNVGATTPEGYGDYFAWGEIEPYYTEGHSQDSPCKNWKYGKTGYNWTSYKWCRGYQWTMTKYCTHYSEGTVDNKTVLEPEDDAARQNWGGNWRTPTISEQEELLDNCTWTLTMRGNIIGYKVVSKTNGNSIFLPFAGARMYEGYLDLRGTDGYYWSSTTEGGGTAFCLRISERQSRMGFNRYGGMSIRAVCQ